MVPIMCVYMCVVKWNWWAVGAMTFDGGISNIDWYHQIVYWLLFISYIKKNYFRTYCRTRFIIFRNEASLRITTNMTSATNFKAVKLVYQYMENIKRDLNYFHGFISSTEKLRNFLDEYRLATNTSFTVRSSRSYLKKRAISAVKAVKNNFSDKTDLSIGPTQALDNVNQSGIIMNSSEKESSIAKDIFENGITEPLTETTETNTDLPEKSDDTSQEKLLLNLTMYNKEKENVVENIEELMMDDSIVTG